MKMSVRETLAAQRKPVLDPRMVYFPSSHPCFISVWCFYSIRRKKYSAEEKIRIVLEGLRRESTIAELCRREGIAQSLYYKLSKDFLEAGKQRLSGNTKRQADSEEVSGMKHENEQLKLLVAELALKNKVLKKSLLGLEGEEWKD